MAFDACMTAAVVSELRNRALFSKVEKVLQPEKDELVLVLHRDRESFRLTLSAGANNPRVHITASIKENPKVAPMFCMLLRKHLLGAKLVEITQPDFERVIRLRFQGADEMGFACDRILVAEIMGKYSNLIFCDGGDRILSAIKVVDFTTSRLRQVLPGMHYEMPPAQDKINPLTISRDAFLSLLREKDPRMPHDKFLTAHFLGISALTAREISFRASGDTDEALYHSFETTMSDIREERFTPVLISDPDTGRPLEFSCIPIAQYGSAAVTETLGSFGELIDRFYSDRDRQDRIRQRSADIFHLLTNAETRLQKKIALQERDLADCASKEKQKQYGDLITANLYRLERGMSRVRLTDYYSEGMPEVELELDTRLTPSQNAQRYYKRYNKMKSAEHALGIQLAHAKNELAYIYTVFESLTKAENETDLDEIRRELYAAGFASKMKNYTAARKAPAPRPMEFLTDDGRRILCGKNNIQNDALTFHTAAKSDYWFHVKNMPGSHVILLCNGEEPTERDFTQAAMIAAYYSKASDGKNVAVDYTLVRNIKKPGGANPGFVTYSTNYTAYVTPDAALAARLRI